MVEEEADDVARLSDLSGQVLQAAQSGEDLVHRLREHVAEAEASAGAKDGISLLHLKNLIMADYLSNLSFVMLKKVSGQSIDGETSIERLVEDRTVIEKIRPIEKKLRYQINKALRAADKQGAAGDDTSDLRPNPQALITKVEDEGSDEEAFSGGDTATERTGGKYVPPKQVPAYFDEERNGEAEVEIEQRKKKRLLSKGMIEELKQQHLDTPDEVYDQEDVMKKRQVQAIKERIRFEEENFVRLPLPKKMKHNRRQLSTMGTIADEITSFGLNSFSSEHGVTKRKKKSGKSVGKGLARKKFKRK